MIVKNIHQSNIFQIILQVSSINRVLRNLSSSKDTQAHSPLALGNSHPFGGGPVSGSALTGGTNGPSVSGSNGPHSGNPLHHPANAHQLGQPLHGVNSLAGNPVASAAQVYDRICNTINWSRPASAWYPFSQISAGMGSNIGIKYELEAAAAAAAAAVSTANSVANSAMVGSHGTSLHSSAGGTQSMLNGQSGSCTPGTNLYAPAGVVSALTHHHQATAAHQPSAQSLLSLGSLVTGGSGGSRGVHTPLAATPTQAHVTCGTPTTSITDKLANDESCPGQINGDSCGLNGCNDDNQANARRLRSKDKLNRYSPSCVPHHMDTHEKGKCTMYTVHNLGF